MIAYAIPEASPFYGVVFPSKEILGFPVFVVNFVQNK